MLLTSTAIVVATSAHASETVTYTYDALGRLIAVTTSGTVNNGLSVSTGYDPAGNRSTYAVTGAGGSPPPPPPPSPPPPPPPPGNQPPTPVNDFGSQPKCSTRTYNVTGNDTDPDGNYPLALVSVTGGFGWSILNNTTIEFESLGSAGVKVGTYTVRDSLGATATATLSVTVSGGSCM